MASDARTRRDLARLLTRVSRASIPELLALDGGMANDGGWTIAVTGPAGVGKSTLIASLARMRLDRLKREAPDGAENLLAVLAIDPSSPLSGGAILGDRIRMDAVAGDPAIYVRSIASAGAYGGLSRSIVNLLSVAQDHGFPEVLVETVGAGQSEYTAADLADTVLLVLQPETGDVVQAMKSGIMEIADIYVVNKAHLPGAARTVAEVNAMLEYVTPAGRVWHPPVIAVTDPDNLSAVDAAIEAQRAAMGPETMQARRARRERLWLTSMLTRRIEEIADGIEPGASRRARYRQVLEVLGKDLAVLDGGGTS